MHPKTSSLASRDALSLGAFILLTFTSCVDYTSGPGMASVGVNSGNSYSTPYTAGNGVAGGPYALNGVTGTLASVLGYDFTFNAGALTVDKRALTATINSPVAQTYGDLAPTLTGTDVTWGNIYSGDSGVDIDSITFDYGGAISGAINNAGSYTLDITGFSDDNYSLNLVTGVTTGMLTVDKKELTVTLVNGIPTRVSSQPDPTFDLSYSGFVPGDGIGDIDVLPTAGIATPGTTVAGLHDITVAGGSDNNYDLQYTNPVGTLTVTPASGGGGGAIPPPPEPPVTPEPPITPEPPVTPNPEPPVPVEPVPPPTGNVTPETLPNTVIRTAQNQHRRECDRAHRQHLPVKYHRAQHQRHHHEGTICRYGKSCQRQIRRGPQQRTKRSDFFDGETQSQHRDED
jgi:hypothetical protein